MKDIYSPLEIDEEWDQRAPDMGSNEGGGTTVAVAPESGVVNSADMSSEVGTSTLPPEQAADMSNDTNSVPMAGDTVEPTGDMAHDPAHDAAEAVVANEASDVTPAPTDTLDINDMNSNPEPSGVMGDETADSSTEVGGNDVVQPDSTEGDTVETTEEPESMKVSVMGDTEADEPDKQVEAGETFNPETFPGGKMPEPETVEPEAKEDKEPEPELPASPVAEKEKSESEPEAEDDKDDAPELKSFKDRLEQQRQANIEAALRIKERAEDLKKREQDKADEAMANVQHADAEIAEIEDELSRLGYTEAA